LVGWGTDAPDNYRLSISASDELSPSDAPTNSSRALAEPIVAKLETRSFRAVLLDTDSKAGALYRITGLPTTMFVRPDGTIEGRYLGQTNEQILGSHIAAIGA
jgi:hypothetical protein